MKLLYYCIYMSIFLKKTRNRKKTKKTKKTKTQKKTRKIQKKLDKFKEYKRKTQKGGAFTLTIGDPSEYIITTNSNKVNIYTIFKIAHDKCIRHFRVNDDQVGFKFLYLDNKMNNTGILIKRNEDIDAEYVGTIATFIRDNQPIHTKRDFLEQNNIIRLLWSPRMCEKEIDISATEPKIKELNALLKEKCDNLSLSLDYMYNMNGNVSSYSSNIGYLLLCLNHPITGCISSIEVIIDGTNLIINSKTKEEFEGKKYNKLLRAVIIIIAPLLNCTNLLSTAINPISTWLLMNSFNATTTQPEMINFLHEKGVLKSNELDQIITKDMITQDLLKEYHGDMFAEVNLEIDLTNPETIQKAHEVFNELIRTENPAKVIICP